MNSDNGDNNDDREVNRDYFAFPPCRCRPSQPGQAAMITMRAGGDTADGGADRRTPADD